MNKIYELNLNFLDFCSRILEPNTIFNLEIITRKYVLQNSQEIKKSKFKKEEILELLNFLVEKGSAIGYMLRERVL